MSEAGFDELVAYLRERFADGVLMAVHYGEDRSEFLLGEQWFEDYVATADTRSPEQMRRDAVSDLRHADVSSDLYGNEIRADVTVTEGGTGLNLFLDREGVYVWFAPGTTVEVPDDVEACLERVDL